jgi:hypothetical protein
LLPVIDTKLALKNRSEKSNPVESGVHPFTLSPEKARSFLHAAYLSAQSYQEATRDAAADNSTKPLAGRAKS